MKALLSRSIDLLRLPFDVDVAHLLAGEEGVVLQHHLVRVPDYHAQLPVARLPEL